MMHANMIRGYPFAPDSYSVISIYNLIAVFARLLVIFIIVPLLELYVIIAVSSRIGLPETIVLLIIISVIGAALAKREGYNTILRIQQEMNQGRVPGDSLVDGAVILAGAMLLLTPGFITDALGLLMLLPPTRKAAIIVVKRRLKQSIARSKVDVWTSYEASNNRNPEQRRRELEE